MFIEIVNCVLNSDHIVKIETGFNEIENYMIIFYHTFNTEVKFTKVNFEVESLRDDFLKRILEAQKNGENLLKWQS